MAQFNWLNQWRDVGRKNGHSPFDLSKRIAFSSPNGLIQPIHFLETVPDDHIQMDLSAILRSETMNTAAFFSGKMFVDTFFVPYSQLWHNFNQFVSQKEDYHSTSLSGSQFIPFVQLKDIVKFVCNVLLNIYDFQGLFNISGRALGMDMVRLLQFAGIVDLSPILRIIDEDMQLSDKIVEINLYINDRGADYNKSVNLFRLLAYQHIFYDYYRNKYYDNECAIWDTTNNAKSTYIDSFNVDDIGGSRSNDDTLQEYYWFERPDTEHPVLGTAYSRASAADMVRFANILGLHYHQYRKDLFTSLMPATQFGAVSSLSFSDITISNDLIPSDGSSSKVYTSGSTGNLFRLGTSDETDVEARSHWNIPNAFDVLALRRAEVLQQWKQNALRAGNMVDDNFRSHYGVEPYYEADNNVKFLGSWEIPFEINPVTATSSTGAATNGAVGDLAAIGVGKAVGRPIDFQCKDFGVIVSCAYFVSDSYYGCSNLDKANTLIEPFDFFSPEFENVGFEPLGLSAQNNNISMGNKVMGFTPPYTMYKTAVDQAYGAFQNSEYIIKDSENGDVLMIDSGSLSPWIVQRSDIQLVNVLSDNDNWYVDNYDVIQDVSRFYQPANLVDHIFGITYDGSYDTDQFLIAATFNVKAVRPMSVLGLPIFA